MKDHPALAVRCPRCFALVAAACRRLRRHNGGIVTEARQIPHNERRWRHARAIREPSWWLANRVDDEPMAVVA